VSRNHPPADFLRMITGDKNTCISPHHNFSHCRDRLEDRAVESAKFSRQSNFTGPPGPGLRAGNRAVAGKRGNSTTIAATEGPLSTVIGEKGKELKTPRAAIPMVNEALKRKVQSLWPLTAQTFVLDTAAAFEFRFCPVNGSVATVLDGQL
jgi:hypothetical protein